MLRLVQLETCESTNDEAWRLLPESALVTARRQTKGRGRQGRAWEDGGGNVMASLALVPPRELAPAMTWVPLAAGVAAADALRSACGASSRPTGLRLKWPNDIMWGDAKMGGILCESRLKGETLSGLVIGLGLNLALAPEVEGARTTCLIEHLPELKERVEEIRRQFLDSWADQIFFWLSELGQGRAPRLSKAWLAHARLAEFSECEIRGRDGAKVAATALELDERGGLVVRLRDSGEIIHVDQPL